MPDGEFTLVKAPSVRGGARVVKRDETGGFVFDITTSEEYRQERTYTSHPTEEGFNAVDHAIDAPAVLTLEGKVSRTPVRAELVDTPDPEYLEKSLETLEQLRASGEEVIPVTGLRTYPRMRIGSVSTTRTSDDGQSVRVLVHLQEVQTVQSQEGAIPPAPRAPSAGTGSTPSGSAGTESPTPTTPEEELPEAEGEEGSGRRRSKADEWFPERGGS